MTGIKKKFVSLNIFNKFPLVNITDGTQSIVSGYSILNSY